MIYSVVPRNWYRYFLVLSMPLLSLFPAYAAGSEITSKADVDKILLTGGTISDWANAYSIMCIEAAKLPGHAASGDDEVSLLGLSVNQINQRYKGMASAIHSGAQTLGLPGQNFKVKYKSGKVAAVQKLTSSCYSGSIGPWVRTKQEGLRRAELRATEIIEILLTSRADFSTNETLRALYRKRAKLRHELGDDEYATKDISRALSIPVLKDDGKEPFAVQTAQ